MPLFLRFLSCSPVVLKSHETRLHSDPIFPDLLHLFPFSASIRVSHTAVLLAWCIVLPSLWKSCSPSCVQPAGSVSFSAQHRSGCVRHCLGAPCQQSRYFLCPPALYPAVALLQLGSGISPRSPGVNGVVLRWTLVKTTTDVELPGESRPTEACLCPSPFWASHAPWGGKALCSQTPTTGPKATGPSDHGLNFWNSTPKWSAPSYKFLKYFVIALESWATASG